MNADGTAKRNIVRKGRDPMRVREGGGCRFSLRFRHGDALILFYPPYFHDLLLHPPRLLLLDNDCPLKKDDDPENTVLVADEEEARYDGGRRVRQEDIVMSLAAFKVRDRGREGWREECKRR